MTESQSVSDLASWKCLPHRSGAEKSEMEALGRGCHSEPPSSWLAGEHFQLRAHLTSAARVQGDFKGTPSVLSSYRGTNPGLRLATLTTCLTLKISPRRRLPHTVPLGGVEEFHR